MQVRKIAWQLMLALLCTGGVLSCNDVQPYETWIRNVGTEEIDKATVYFGNYVIPGGVIPVSKSANASGIHAPIPELVEIEWQTLDGTMHRKEVAVRKLLPPLNTGEVYQIYFDINGNDVTVYVKTHRYLVPGVDYHIQK